MAAATEPVSENHCDCCGTSHAFGAAAGHACPNCDASLEDRVLTAALLAAYCRSPQPRLESLISEVKRRNLLLAALGNVFGSLKRRPAIFTYAFRASGQDLIAGSDGRRHLPVQDGSLDGLIAARPSDLCVNASEIARVLKPGGRLMVAGGFRWPLPETSDPPLADGALFHGSPGTDLLHHLAAVGLAARFDRPFAGWDVLQRHVILSAKRLSER